MSAPTIEFSEGAVCLTSCLEPVSHEYGAEAIFIGRVREQNLGRKVLRLEYELHPVMARQVIARIVDEASKSFESRTSIEVRHSFGSLELGEPSVYIRVCTPHRKEAFAICRYLIDQLKHRAPIWKKEYYVDGESEWVKGHELCGGHEAGGDEYHGNQC